MFHFVKYKMHSCEKNIPDPPRGGIGPRKGSGTERALDRRRKFGLAVLRGWKKHFSGIAFQKRNFI